MKLNRAQLEHRDAEELARGYSARFRALEVAGITAFFVLLCALAARLWNPAVRNPWLVCWAVLIGYLAADFVSGFVHWMGDTWGTPEWPILGKSLIRPFREHHVDQSAITRHDFIETNGSNCLISLPVQVGALLIPVSAAGRPQLFVAAFLGSLVTWVFGTNQFHKWAHLSHPTGAVAWMQRMRLVLPPAHHAIHHSAPYSRYYCITVGWMNWPLTKVRFFPLLERIITGLTGAIPRHDDIGKAAALESVGSVQVNGTSTCSAASIDRPRNLEPTLMNESGTSVTQ